MEHLTRLALAVFVVSVTFVNFQSIEGKIGKYCRLQNSTCKLKHIACSNHDEFDAYSETWREFRHLYFTHHQKDLLLRRLNTLKNRIAHGDLKNEGFPQAAGFKRIVWNREFEFLANLTVYKIPFFADACTLVNNYESTYMLYYEDWRGESEISHANFFDEAIGAIIHEIRIETPEWMGTYFAEANKIGCAYAEFYGAGVDEEDLSTYHRVLRMRCILNSHANDYGLTYEIGAPCSHCQNGGVCDALYTSLCI